MKTNKIIHHRAMASGGGQVPTKIVLVGAGGNGSQLLSRLVQIHLSLVARGEAGLDVVLYDPDIVTEANIGRQLYAPVDVGQNKATALIHRANMNFGLYWDAQPIKYEGQPNSRGALGSGKGYQSFTADNILITCVDTGAARKAIYNAVMQQSQGIRPAYWLDLGNERDTGQVWLGEFPRLIYGGKVTGSKIVPNARLKTVVEYQPRFYDGTIKETDSPSCSLAEALTKQDLFICTSVSTAAAHLLWRLLSTGEIDMQGFAINLPAGIQMPFPIVAENCIPCGEDGAGMRPARKKRQRAAV